MPDVERQSLTDLTARTATADSDLIHVNSGGTDYKQTKTDFVKDLVEYHEFNNTSTLLSQVEALASVKSPAYYAGKINSYGHYAATGVPVDNSFHVRVSIYSGQYIEVRIIDVDYAQQFIKLKHAGTWDSTWTMEPRRNEIDALNSSLTNSLIVGTPYTDTISLTNAGINVVDVSIGSPPTISGYTFQFWIPVSSTYRFAPMGYGSSRLYYYVGTTSTSGGVVIFYPIYSKNA